RQVADPDAGSGHGGRADPDAGPRRPADLLGQHRPARADVRKTNMTTRIERLMVGALLVGVLGMAGCEVTNPGPVADADLDRPAVHQAVANGSGREISRAIGNIGYI